jgi:PAS domain S-box-containing protein
VKQLRSAYNGYLIAVLMVALVAISRRFVFDKFFGDGLPLRLFMVAVIVSAWNGGLKPGLLAVLLAAVTAPMLLGHGASLGSIDWSTTIVFILIGSLVSGFMESLHRTRRNLENKQQQLEHEIAERYKAEIAQAQSEVEQRRAEEYVRAVVNTVIDGIISIDADGMIESFNPAAEQIFGYTSTEVIGKNVKILMPEPYTGEHDGYLTNYKRTGDVKIIGIGREVMGRRKDGSTFPMDLAVSDAQVGSRRFFTGIVRDSTERTIAEGMLRLSVTEAEERAKEAEEKNSILETIFDNIPEGVVLAGGPPNFPILANSRFGQELLNRPIDTAVGIPVGDHAEPYSLLMPDGVTRPRREDLPLYRATRFGERVRNVELFIDRSDGSKIPILVDAAPVRDQQGNIIGAVNCWRDISERKQSEFALREADRRKDQFLAILAHELRNPLTPISNALQLWPLVEHDQEEMESLRVMMDRQVRQITRLIDDLMDVSRITRGKIGLRKQHIDLCALLNAAIESIQPVVDAYGHRMTVTSPEAPIFVNGDPARLTQVFGNILNNAAKYTGRNGVIWVSITAKDEKAIVSIRDNGSGIPSHMLHDIFEIFRQVDGTINRSNGGLGIGLTLVKQLVELHDGTVEAHSDGPGKGSEFVVLLPLVATNVNGQQVGGPHYQLRQINLLPRHRILVVDDVQASADTLARILRGMGQEVAVANNGRAAIDWVRSKKPDVVFLDIAMPEMNGYDVARSLRGNAELATTVLVALTGYGQEEDRRQAFEAGFNHHMMKPPSVETLERVLLALPRECQSEVPSADRANG